MDSHSSLETYVMLKQRTSVCRDGSRLADAHVVPDAPPGLIAARAGLFC
jgi:hypothetical protein